MSIVRYFVLMVIHLGCVLCFINIVMYLNIFYVIFVDFSHIILTSAKPWMAWLISWIALPSK